MLPSQQPLRTCCAPPPQLSSVLSFLLLVLTHVSFLGVFFSPSYLNWSTFSPNVTFSLPDCLSTAVGTHPYLYLLF